jgi:NMD protein affecting ribosome stability and mRNA decay
MTIETHAPRRSTACITCEAAQQRGEELWVRARKYLDNALVVILSSYNQNGISAFIYSVNRHHLSIKHLHSQNESQLHRQIYNYNLPVTVHLTAHVALWIEKPALQRAGNA